MTDTIPPDHYAALGIGKDANLTQIKTAYKKAALKHHPDKAQDKAAASDQFHRISQAYETLVDDDKRRKYEDTLKFAQFKRTLQDRRTAPPASAFGGSTVHSRGPSGDVKYSATPRSPYATSGAFSQTRVYEERRPRDRMWDEDYAPRHEETRASSRKYPEYAPSPKQQFRSPSSRQEDARRAPRDERPSPKSRVNAKKQQDQNIRKARQNKHFSTSSVESGLSDSEDDYRSRRRDDRAEDYGRNNQPQRRNLSGEPPREESYFDKLGAAREYMGRSRPASRSPPSYRRESAPQQYQSAPRGTEARRDSHETRPNVRRTTSNRHAESYPTLNRSRTTSVREPSGARRSSRTPEDDRRAPPRMPESASSPADVGKLPAMVNENVRRATVPTESSKASRQNFRRAETTPNLNRSESMRTTQYPAAGVRRRSEQPQAAPSHTLHGHSHLRQQENNHDSGYSTSNSPSEEVPPEKENVPMSKKQTYHYSGSTNNIHRTVQVESGSSDSEDDKPAMAANASAFRNYGMRQPTTEIRMPGSARRTPQVSRSSSPLGEKDVRRSRANSTSSVKHQAFHSHGHSTATDRAAGPPPSHSAKYAHYMTPSSTTATHGSASDRERERERDYQAQSSSRPSSRRPSVSRTQSGSKVSQLNRANTMPVRPTVDTQNVPTNRSREGLLFGEKVVASPVEMQHRSDGEGRLGGYSDRENRDKRKGDEGTRRRYEEASRRPKREYMRDAARDRSPRLGVKA